MSRSWDALAGRAVRCGAVIPTGGKRKDGNGPACIINSQSLRRGQTREWIHRALPDIGSRASWPPNESWDSALPAVCPTHRTRHFQRERLLRFLCEMGLAGARAVSQPRGKAFLSRLPATSGESVSALPCPVRKRSCVSKPLFLFIRLSEGVLPGRLEKQAPPEKADLLSTGRRLTDSSTGLNYSQMTGSKHGLL
ncbi:hypothetical protein AAFF_G00230150 [Aldrovandia affinis]|uniref:Uncharacterized protein n=1 Tax=Aldrovandia affinis TaxID=143900 RepID=A0AAD7SVK6_9TELE|nr:hypothetical protein AAFF_G00230150 [Aldrovandia affinis]